MTFTPNTEDIRDAWIVAPGMDEEWDRWFNRVRAEVWEQGYRASLTGTGSNPYRTEAAPVVDDAILVGFNGHVSRIGSRGIDYSRLADYANGAVGTTEEG